MKKLLFWMVLIVGILALVGSCAKKDSTSTTTSTAACTASDTASGSITGMDNMTGTYSLSWYGSSGNACIDNSSAITTFKTYNVIPDDTLSFKGQYIITSSTSFTESVKFYTDAACATSSGYRNEGYTSVTAGDNITMTTAPSPFPTYATKVSYTYSCFVGKGETDNATTLLNNLGIGTFTKGTELAVDVTDVAYYNIMAIADNVSGSSYNWFYYGSKSTSNSPDNFSANNDVTWQ